MRSLLLILLAALPLQAFAKGKALDFWDEELRLFGVASGEDTVSGSLDARRQSGYTPKFVELDHADHRAGDLSLVYKPSSAAMPERFGFVSSLWDQSWSLAPDMSLKVWIKAEGLCSSDAWDVVLRDQAGAVAHGTLLGAGDSWKELEVDFSSFHAGDGFQWGAVEAIEFEAPLSENSVIHIDGARLEGAGRSIGITDKSLSQRMAEADSSRDFRASYAFRQQAASLVGTGAIPLSANEARGRPEVTAFAMMMANERLDTANQILIDTLNESSVLTVWDLASTPLYIRFYYMFSSRAGKYPGRLTPEAETLLLETLWERTAAKNDIALARQSTWWMDGSENHDLNAKASSLLVSRIFMNEPAYRGRIWPDYGYGGAYHYGHAGYYGPGIDYSEMHGGGRANLSDGKEYTAADHYEAWTAFFKEYFRERAKRGFFLEYGSPGYSKHSLGFVDLVYQYSGDDELHQLVGDFVTLFWADWAQVSNSGIRGGPKTRHHHNVGGPEDKATADLVSFYLGGPGNPDAWWYWSLINDYELPPVVWQMILDREGMGDFTYKARGIGEEENVWPRPAGAERALLVDTDARFLKSTYVTPSYTIGTQMDHPAAIHSHLSIAGRWHGMTFAQSPASRIVTVGLPKGLNLQGKPVGEFDLEIMMHSVLDEQTMILQQSRRWTAVHPDWYPADGSRYDKDIGVWFGQDWDERLEQGGWVFVRKGNAYAAVRPVTWDEPYERAKPSTGVGNQINFNKPYDDPTVKICGDCYGWNEDETILQLTDKFAPIIIEAGDRDDYASIEAFMSDVLDNPLALYKTVVPGFHILVYTGLNGEEIVFNAGAPSIPTIGGVPVDYEYGMTFDSPYLRSEYRSGKVALTFGADTLQLDFSGD